VHANPHTHILPQTNNKQTKQNKTKQPMDLRQKKTRAIRRALGAHEMKKAKTVRYAVIVACTLS
jgi:hypothetical protein